MMKPASTAYVFLLFTFTLFFSGCTEKERAGEGGFVEDFASLLKLSEEDRISKLSEALLRDIGIHILVYILDESPDDIDDKAVQVFQKYRPGGATGDARGILFLIDPEGEEVRIEIGYVLEHIFTDSFVGYIERKQMKPFFRSGRIGPGIEATMELMVGKAHGKLPDKDFEGKPVNSQDAYLSGGGGAKTGIVIGKVIPEKKKSPLTPGFKPQSTVASALDRYRELLRLRIKDPGLGLYTPESREFMNTWIVTDAQQDNELKEIEKALATVEIAEKGGLAVIRFSSSMRKAPPYFLVKGEEGWMFDFVTMSRLIGFNHRNEWFMKSLNHMYMFAFSDLSFDRNGFPHKR